MQIGQGAQTIEGLHEALQYFLDQTLYHEVPESKAVVSRSSTEAEYKSVVNATTEVMWVQMILHELGIKSPKYSRLWCDNIGATYLSANPMFHTRTKHLNFNFYFVRERVAQGLFHIQLVSTNDQVAYEFTKPLSVR